MGGQGHHSLEASTRQENQSFATPGRLNGLLESPVTTPLELESSHFGKKVMLVVDAKLAYLAGLAYGDGTAVYGEVRLITSDAQFKVEVIALVREIAHQYQATFRVYSRPGNISDRPQITIALNSTTIRRVLFDEKMQPKYDTMRQIAMSDELAPHFLAGLTDAEGSLVLPQPVEYPHGRVFAITNNDRRLLGIARVSMARCLRMEPSSLRIRLYSRKGRRHTIRGVTIVARKNNYILEVCSGAKLKWLDSVGRLLQHPAKASRAAKLLATYPLA